MITHPTYFYIPSKNLMLVEVRELAPNLAYTSGIFEVTPKIRQDIERNFALYRKHLYRELSERDQQQYVLIERKPGTGFERIVPEMPKYDHELLKAWRNWMLESIENLEESVSVSTEGNVATGEIAVFLNQHTRTGMAQWRLKPSKMKRSELTIDTVVNQQRFFIPRIQGA